MSILNDKIFYCLGKIYKNKNPDRNEIITECKKVKNIEPFLVYIKKILKKKLKNKKYVFRFKFGMFKKRKF